MVVDVNGSVSVNKTREIESGQWSWWRFRYKLVSW